LLDLIKHCPQREAKTEARLKTQYFFLLSASTVSIHPHTQAGRLLGEKKQREIERGRS